MFYIETKHQNNINHSMFTKKLQNKKKGGKAVAENVLRNQLQLLS